MFIICTESGVDVARYEYDFCDVSFDGNTHFHGDKVTHWMPMPSRPHGKLIIYTHQSA
ncbi:DUF551 domain-containing protein [Providencia heimbachae]|uniref:DUF551 domain-containing protein n=1 Tax=Providencia heimbachae TaxID=333962 RepID=UPI0009EE299F|nr:DUF551 domain-containing protein [Providencia sp.]NIH23229.1 DUF551 domain-containing protein [Providencia heimbachae]